MQRLTGRQAGGAHQAGPRAWLWRSPWSSARHATCVQSLSSYRHSGPGCKRLLRPEKGGGQNTGVGGRGQSQATHRLSIWVHYIFPPPHSPSPRRTAAQRTCIHPSSARSQRDAPSSHAPWPAGGPTAHPGAAGNGTAGTTARQAAAALGQLRPLLRLARRQAPFRSPHSTRARRAPAARAPKRGTKRRATEGRHQQPEASSLRLPGGKPRP